MFNWEDAAAALIDQDDIFCLVMITKTSGSTPRDMGTIMLVTENAEFGTIGGGNFEHAATKSARALLSGKDTQLQTLDYILGPDVEQCCGGRVVLSLRLISSPNDLCKTGDWPKTNAKTNSPVFLFGGGHVGKALANTLAPLPFVVHHFDNRPEKMTAQLQMFSDPQDAVSSAPPSTLFLIMSHDHGLDYKLVSAVLHRADFGFCGLIGSKTKRARFFSRLKKDGFTNKQLSGLTCPIGIERIQGKEPEIIAASVAAQLLQIARR